jgi:hypothetical protein
MLTLDSQAEVRCHLGCPWTDGWVVAEVVGANSLTDPEYRVRRVGHDRALGMVLPAELVRPLHLLCVSG